jgi:hypothetical protein
MTCAVMKIREGGRRHAEGDPYCISCDAPEGERHPQICGVNHCNGLRHAERLETEEGWEFAYRCDKCGETA